MIIQVVSATGWSREFTVQYDGDISVGASVHFDHEDYVLDFKVTEDLGNNMYKLVNPNMVVIVEAIQ